MEEPRPGGAAALRQRRDAYVLTRQIGDDLQDARAMIDRRSTPRGSAEPRQHRRRDRREPSGPEDDGAPARGDVRRTQGACHGGAGGLAPPYVREVVRRLEMISHFQRGGTEG